MEFITENLQILATLGSALVVYCGIRRASKKEHLELKEEMKLVKESLNQVDKRLNRLEGRFEERGYWESRVIRKTGTEGQE